ncbi:hypothetical protein M8C21_015304, partial [Ambrosia artemisiifolia]
ERKSRERERERSPALIFFSQIDLCPRLNIILHYYYYYIINPNNYTAVKPTLAFTAISVYVRFVFFVSGSYPIRIRVSYRIRDRFEMTTGADVDCNVGGNGNVLVNGSVDVDPLVLESAGAVNGRVAVSVVEVNDVEDDANVENGPAVEDHVVMVSDGIGQGGNGCFDKELGEGEMDDAELDVTGLNAVGGVVTVDCNVGGNGSVGEFGDAGGGNVDGEVEQFKKEGLVENGSAFDLTVDPLVLESAGVVNGRVAVSVVEVKAVEDAVNDENGSADDPPVVMVTNGIGKGVDGCLDKVLGEGEVDVKSAEEVDDTGSGLTGSTMNAVESSQVTGSELESAVKSSDVTVIQFVAAPDVNVENGSAVDLLVVMDVNGRLDKVSGEQEVDVKSAEEVDDTGSGLTESTLNTVESVQVIGYELGAAVKASDVTVTQSVATPDVINGIDESLSAPIAISDADNGVMVNDGLGSVINLTDGIAQDANGHLDKFSGEREADVKSVEEADNAKTNDTASGLADSTLNIEESSQVTASELEFAIKPSDVTVTQSVSAPIAISNTDNGVMVNDGLEPVFNVVDKAECQLTVDGSVTADGLDSSGSPIDEWKGQATDDVSGKPYEDMGSQVTADEPESCGGPIKGQECKVSVDGSDFISSLVDKQECPVSVNESEPSAKHTDKVESNTVVVELDGKSEDHQELVAIPSEVNVEVELNHVCSVIKAENKKDEGTEIGSGIESEENPDSGFVLPEEVDALANGQVEKFDRILEMEETQIYVTEADESSEKLLKVSESVETEVNTEEIKEQVKVEDEIQESQRVVIDNVQDELNLEDNTAESANEAEVLSEVETNLEAVILENASLQYAVSNCVDKPQEGLQPEASAVETTNTMESACNSRKLLVEKDNGSLSNPDDLTVTEKKVETEYHLGKDNISAEDMDCGTGIENVNVADDDGKGSEVKDAEDVPHPVTEIRSPEGMDCGTSVENVVISDDEEKGSEVNDAHVELVHDIVPVNKPAEDMDCETGIKSVDFPDKEKESEVKDASVGDQPTLSFCDTFVKHGAVIEFGSIGRHETTPSIQNEEVEDMNGIQSDEIPKSSVEGEVIDVQNEEVEVLEYNFLVKIPRFEDEKFRDQIRRAQELLKEKTGIRDSIRVTVFEKRELLKAYSEEYDRVKLDEIAARRVVRAKRQEIESVQAVINRWKNAMAVEDIDARIFGVEYMIQHETIRLTDEKAFIRDIRRLKSLRDELASNMGTPEEIRHAIDTKDQNEERMKQYHSMSTKHVA